MIRLNYFSFLLFLGMLFVSCDDGLNEIEQELYDNIIGRWEIVSYRSSGLGLSSPKHCYILNGSMYPNYCFEILNFNVNGNMELRQDNLRGSRTSRPWIIKDDALWINNDGFGYKETIIYNLTKTEFHFKILYPNNVDKDGYWGFELKR